MSHEIAQNVISKRFNHQIFLRRVWKNRPVVLFTIIINWNSILNSYFQHFIFADPTTNVKNRATSSVNASLHHTICSQHLNSVFPQKIYSATFANCRHYCYRVFFGIRIQKSCFHFPDLFSSKISRTVVHFIPFLYIFACTRSFLTRILSSFAYAYISGFRLSGFSDSLVRVNTWTHAWDTSRHGTLAEVVKKKKTKSS